MLNEAEIAAAVARACEDKDIGTDGIHRDLREIAIALVRFLGSTRSGMSATPPEAMLLRMGDNEITFYPDDKLIDKAGNTIFRRIRTGHLRSAETKDLGAAIAMLAAADNDTEAIVELVHLADEEITQLDLSQKVLGNRHKRLSEILAEIDAGQFSPIRSERTCPGCPAFFVCGTLPEGRIEKSF